MIKAWSHSRLAVFEQCPLRAKLAYIDKIPEPERPLPPGKTEHANERGERVHTAAEMFVRGGVELIPELESFRAEFEHLRQLYSEGKVSLEGEWGYSMEWMPIAYFDKAVWLRVKLDAMVRMSPQHATVIDYKTGKKSGNEVKHAEQGQLYAVGTALRYPEIEEITTEFWYTDQNELTSVVYDRGDIERFRQRFEERGLRITSAEEFPAKPNIFNCKWCPYGPKGTGHCSVGIQR